MIIALSMVASATELEMNAEVASMHNGDPQYDLFNDSRDSMTGFGIGLGVRPSSKKRSPLALRAGWHHHTTGSDVRPQGGSGFVAAFTTDTFTAGPKLDIDIAKTFAPYVSAQLVVMRGLARFDDDLSVNDNPGQVSVAGAAPGGLFTAGVEISTPDIRGLPVEFLWHIEMGYALMAEIPLTDVGSVRPGGFALRSGIGVRWGRSR